MLILLAFFALTADEPASAPAIKASVTKPAPAPELDQLKYFEGNWNCDGRAEASSFGPEHTFKATFKVKADLDKFWYQVSYEEKKSKDHPLPFATHGFWGFDNANQRLVRLFAGAFGVGETAFSPGFAGGDLVWTGEITNYMGQAKLGFRQTLSKKSPREFVERYEFEYNHDWVSPVTTTCKK